MKKILFYVLIPVFIFAQYGNNKISNGTFDTSTSGWTEGAVHITHYTTDDSSIGRVNVLQGTVESSGTNRRVQYTYGLTTPADTFTLKWDYYYPSSNTSGEQFALLLNGSASLGFSCDNVQDTWSTNLIDLLCDGTVITTVNFYTYSTGCFNSCTPGDAFYLDNITLRQKIHTIYIDPDGDNTANGEISTPIATIDECDLRGYYAGGAVNIASGTYDETMDVTAGITITGSACTVTEIACGSNAVTLEGTDFVITTLTGTNITDNRIFTTDDGQDKGFKLNILNHINHIGN